MPDWAWAPVRPHRYPSPARPDRPARFRPRTPSAQVRDEDLFVTLDPESNSLAVLIQHM